MYMTETLQVFGIFNTFNTKNRLLSSFQEQTFAFQSDVKWLKLAFTNEN